MGHLPLTRLWRWTQASVSVGELVVWLVMVIVRPDQSLGAAYVGRIVGGVCGKWLDRSPAKSSPSDRNGDGICHICMIIRPSSDPLDLVPRREHADRQPVSLLAKRSGKFGAAARGHIARRAMRCPSRERIGTPKATLHDLGFTEVWSTALGPRALRRPAVPHEPPALKTQVLPSRKLAPDERFGRYART